MKKINNYAIVLWLLFTSVLSLQAADKIKVACIGNSITFGTGLSHPAMESYPAQLQEILGERYEVGNFGRPGATLLKKGHRPYVKQEEYNQALAFAGDIAVIHLGINDTDPRNWPHYKDEFIQDYVSLIQDFKRVNPACRVIICRMTPISHRHPRFESGTRDWHGDIQHAIEIVAQATQVQLTDLHPVLYPYPFMLADGLHPDSEGALRLARHIASVITGDFGGLQVSSLYSDNMVLQRNQPLTLQGVADAEQEVLVEIAGQKQKTVANGDGRWTLQLQPLKAGVDYVLEISSAGRTLIFKHVAVGEVWLCSGQSNMEFRLDQASTAQADIPLADHAAIRFFDMKGRWSTSNQAWSLEALDSVNHLAYYVPTQWEICNSQHAARFSAVGYYFAKMLQDSLQVPVGIICNAVGGSTTESWIDRHTLEYQFPAILRDWKNNDFIQAWVRERAKVNIRNSRHPLQRHPYEPCYLYEAGIQPLQSFPIQGVIWYQGESNAHFVEGHEKLFPLLVDSWRKNWHREDLPFYYVQLSSLNCPSWPWFRDSQRRLMQQIPYTAMAVSSDQGDSLDVHPRNKRPIGERLARWALYDTYQYSCLPSGPLVQEAEAVGSEVHIRFDYGEGMHAGIGTAIIGFELAETDGLFVPAVARVKGNEVIISAHGMKVPRFVRYGWQPFTRANLVNRDGLPASTFRLEIIHP